MLGKQLIPRVVAKCSALIWLALVALPAFADDPAFFRTSLRIGLCSQYNQGARLELSYRIGTSSAETPLQILTQQLDASGATGNFQVMLPRTLGTTPMTIRARCVNASGASRWSNALTISNCDLLKFSDTDADGVPNNLEDTNCDNSFSPGDLSNPDNIDTDGDGVRDLVERVEATDPTNPGNSPRPFVFSGASFDPDGDGNSNPVVWRSSGGMWFVKDFVFQGNHIAFQFGLPGDIPFTYSPEGHYSDTGVVRRSGTQLVWYFRGAGFQLRNGQRANVIPFGLFGDNILVGPWERGNVSNPAVARLYNGNWYFYFYRSDGTVGQAIWGGNGDVPKVQDYDGDGLFDVAVYRPSEQKTYVIHSRDGGVKIYEFGSGTGDHTVRGDVTGDGTDDIINWEPATGMFQTLKSDFGFEPERANQRVGLHTEEMQLGLYYVHLPLSWYRLNGLVHYAVVDHARGLRYIRQFNDGFAPPFALQWGLPGDSQG